MCAILANATEFGLSTDGHIKTTDKPLANLLILDFSRFFSGPLATLRLTDMGECYAGNLKDPQDLGQATPTDRAGRCDGAELSSRRYGAAGTRLRSRVRDKSEIGLCRSDRVRDSGCMAVTAGPGSAKRRREVKELNQLMMDVVARAYAKVGSDPAILGEPDVPVRAPLKPKPHIRS
jgi:hypothetical protein